MRATSLHTKLLTAGLAIQLFGPGQAAAQITLRVADYAAVPMTGSAAATGNAGSLARVNFLREEPGGQRRLFVNDLNGPLYILDKNTKTFTTYLDFNGRDTAAGLFDRFTFALGYANGLVCLQFDPDYVNNGKFYTIHIEDPGVTGSLVPDNTKFPGLNISGYTPTQAVPISGTIEREEVLIEWTDSNISNSIFEGTARELMRLQLNRRIHPMGDLVFNPTAKRGDADWRVLYIGSGDGGSGESSVPNVRMHPQRLDTLVGKILRIIPDLKEHTDSSAVSENGRYRIPNDNPFAGTAGAKKEIWATGLRNPHRLIWDFDPANPKENYLIAASVGLSTWETLNIIHKGANYGYSLREGNELLQSDNKTARLPEVDRIPIQISETVSDGTIEPAYPVVQYGHNSDGGEAIAGGFVYRGTRFSALRGKFVFGDIRRGRIWYVDYKEMLAADDREAGTLAKMHEVQISLDNSGDNQTHPNLSFIVNSAFRSRAGIDPAQPVRPLTRVDIRFATDSSGEIYILSKIDGMIRTVSGVTSKQD